MVNKYDADAVVCECSAEALNVGRNGLPSFLPSRSDSLYGYLGLVNEYKKYLERGFDEDLIVSEHGGTIPLFWNI